MGQVALWGYIQAGGVLGRSHSVGKCGISRKSRAAPRVKAT